MSSARMAVNELMVAALARVSTPALFRFVLCFAVNRPPSGNNRNLAVGTIVAGARGTAIVGVNGMIDPAASRGNFGLNVHGTNTNP